MSHEKKAGRCIPTALLGLVALLLVCGLASCLFFKKPPVKPQIEIAKVETAREMLVSVANAAILYSGQHGGNGQTNFPANTADIVDNIPLVFRPAVIGCTKEAKAIDGYLCRLIPSETKDNFLFEAYPATGFSGETFVITKDEKVINKKEFRSLPDKPDNATQGRPSAAEKTPVQRNSEGKTVAPRKMETKPATALPPSQEKSNERKTDTLKKRASELFAQGKAKIKEGVQKIKETFDPPPPPPPPIVPGKPSTANEMLKSVYNACILFSAQNGGNGKTNFPTKPTQIADAVPEVIKKAIVFLPEEEEKAVPLDGYILIMYPAKTQSPTDDFCFVAYPAKYFSGPQFEITKSGIVTEISTK